MVNDVISDGLTRIRNAGMRRLEVATLMHSKIIESIVKILVEKEYLDSYTVAEDKNKKSINVVLKYDDKGYTVINELKRVSKPGRRVYKASGDIKSFKNGYGTIIVSTSKGVIDNNEARRLNVGGEVLCSVW